MIEASKEFQALITACIVLAGIVIGLSTDGVGSMAVLNGLDLGCLVIFTIEIFIKVERWRHLFFFWLTFSK